MFLKTNSKFIFHERNPMKCEPHECTTSCEAFFNDNKENNLRT